MTPKTLPQQQPSVRTYLTRSRKASLPSQAAAAAGLGKHDSQATSESPLPRRNLRKRPYGDLATPTKLVDDSLSASPAPKESRVLKRRKLKIKDDVEDGSSEFAEDQIRGKELEAPREPPVRSSIVPAAPALSEVSEAPPVPLDIIQRQTRIAQDPTKPVPQSRLPPDSPVLSTFDGPPSVAEPSAEPSVKPVERALRNVKASDAADRAKAPTETELESPDAGSIHDHISILEEKRLAYLDRRLSLDKSLSRQAAAPTLFRTVAPTHLSASASSLYTQIGQVDSKLSLPPKYEGLEQQFCELERALALFKARDKAANFEDLKVTIRLASRSSFDLKELGQIRTVYPSAYTYTPIRLSKSGTSIYTLKLAIPEASVRGESTSAEMRSSTAQTLVDGLIDQAMIHQALKSSNTADRRMNFHQSLLARVKRYHREYLDSLSLGLSQRDEDLYRWHPNFKLDDVPEIPSASFPELTELENKTRMVLLKARGLYRNRMVLSPSPSPSPRIPPSPAVADVSVMNLDRDGCAEPSSTAATTLSKATNDIAPRPIDALTARPESGAVVPLSEATRSPSSESPSEMTGGRKQIQDRHTAMLERIREKSRKKQEEEIFKPDPKVARETKLASRLPDMVRTLKSYFLSNKKHTLPWKQVSVHLMQASRNLMTILDISDAIVLLNKIAPDYIQKFELGMSKETMIKTNKDIGLADILERISQWKRERGIETL